MQYLRQPYPFYHKGKELIRIAFLLFVIGYLFELLIVPFPRNPSEHLYAYWIISLYHVGVAVVLYAAYFLFLGMFIKEDDWKVFKEFLAVFGLLITIGVGQWAIRPIIYSNNSLTTHYLFEEVWHACLSGGLIYLLVTLVNVNFLTRKHQSESLSFSTASQEANEELVKIKTQNLSDDFDLRPSQFICAKAEGNYLKIYQHVDSGVVGVLKRITLQRLGEQLASYEFILKTHRGYLVNTHYINNISGNAQGYQLDLASINFAIPVSRKHLASFREVMN